MSDDRIPIYISMGEVKCVGHASRALANTIYRQNVADLHTEKVEVEPAKEAWTDERSYEEYVQETKAGGDDPLPEDKWGAEIKGKEHPAEPPVTVDKVIGVKLKPFTVMAVTLDRGRVSRKVIMEERAAEAEPFPEGVAIEDVEAPTRYGGITVGADDWAPSAGQKAEASAATQMEIVGMGPKEIDRIAAEHVADISSAMGGRSRETVPLIQNRAYSGHAWEWGDTHINLDELWDKLDESERLWLYDEVMAIVQDDSPTKAKEGSTTKKLVGPGDATYDEMKRENIDESILHRRG